MSNKRKEAPANKRKENPVNVSSISYGEKKNITAVNPKKKQKNSKKSGIPTDITDLKIMHRSATESRYTFSNKQTMDFIAYTRRGIQEGKNSGTYFMRLDSQLEDDGKFRGKVSREFITKMKEVDDYTMQVYGATKEFHKANWPEMWEKGEPTLICGSGYLNALEESKKYAWDKVVLCIFPSKWTTCETFHTSTKKSSPAILPHFVQSTGNSYFTGCLYFNTTEFTVDPEKHTIKAETYLNVDSITWINSGQDVTVYAKEDQENKEARAAERTAKTLAFLGDFSGAEV